MKDLILNSGPAKAGDERDWRWRSVQDRDQKADGVFVYAVRTTGVYCRPSCASRRARRENVTFYDNGVLAKAAGYRSCLRCRPDLQRASMRHADQIARACRLIETADALPKLGELAVAVGMSRFHFHRTFKTMIGLSPKAYGAAWRAKRLKEHLDKGQSVTEAIYEAGFNANSRFYEAADAMLGMTPTAYKKGGEQADIRFAVGESSLGPILVACSAKGVCAILLGDDPDALAHDLQRRFPHAHIIGADRAFEDLIAKVVGFVDDPRIGLDLPLDLRGTVFQQRVWQILRDIPAGSITSYGEIASLMNRPRAARAVARACAANAIAVAIPCHRVVQKSGKIAGYRWGVERKRALLARESSK